ncbi:unnamed protein product [Phytophthora fragariaefolia]|uniref:Unnamed protein product n=1 Tax=Phytophthora fragariaefolia TaxID=1490495 RepID=A0A9W7D0L9_9STRA|nr:unnamed protein product [Phytophthora fragariaefolia]
MEYASFPGGVCAQQCGAFVDGLHAVLRERPAYTLSLPPATSLGAGGAGAEDARDLKCLRPSVKRSLLSFIATGEAVQLRVRDAMNATQDTQNENSDLPVQKSPAHGAADDVSPQGHCDQPRRGTRRSEDDCVESPSPSAGYPGVAGSSPWLTKNFHPDSPNLTQVGHHHANLANDA